MAAPSHSLPSPIPYSTDDGATFQIGNLAMVTLGAGELLRVTAVNQTKVRM